MTVVATIPARGGSKGVIKKNIRLLKGYPLIAYSIAAAKLAKSIDRVIVSTDSEEIAEIAKSFGAEVPFLRPSEFARDDSPDNEHIIHTIEWFEKNEGKAPDTLVHLRPTTPLRDPQTINDAVLKFNDNSKATSLRSAHVCPITPQKTVLLSDDGFFTSFTADGMDEINKCRQSFPIVYLPNGYVDIISVNHVKKTGRLHDQVLSFIVPQVTDIDTIDDFKRAVTDLQNSVIYNYLEENFKRKIYCFDLDGTLCTNTDGKYNEAVPFMERIAKVNKIHDEGNRVIIDTARGSVTKKDWNDLTKSQLKTWGVKYDELRVGHKVTADIYIDDKGIEAGSFFEEN